MSSHPAATSTSTRAMSLSTRCAAAAVARRDARDVAALRRHGDRYQLRRWCLIGRSGIRGGGGGGLRSPQRQSLASSGLLPSAHATAARSMPARSAGPPSELVDMDGARDHDGRHRPTWPSLVDTADDGASHRC